MAIFYFSEDLMKTSVKIDFRARQCMCLQMKMKETKEVRRNVNESAGKGRELCVTFETQGEKLTLVVGPQKGYRGLARGEGYSCSFRF